MLLWQPEPGDQLQYRCTDSGPTFRTSQPNSKKFKKLNSKKFPKQFLLLVFISSLQSYGWVENPLQSLQFVTDWTTRAARYLEINGDTFRQRKNCHSGHLWPHVWHSLLKNQVRLGNSEHFSSRHIQHAAMKLVSDVNASQCALQLEGSMCWVLNTSALQAPANVTSEWLTRSERNPIISSIN